MNMLGRIFCSNPFSFVLGFGVGLVGFYIVHKVEEQRKLEREQEKERLMERLRQKLEQREQQRRESDRYEDMR